MGFGEDVGVYSGLSVLGYKDNNHLLFTLYNNHKLMQFGWL